MAARPLSVLVVDDDPDTAFSMGLLLHTLGHDATATTSAEAALRLAEERPPDVVLLDLAMPAMDGFALADRLRRLTAPKRPFLIAVTGRGRAEDRARCVASGIDLFFLKPADPAVLAWVLDRLRQVVLPLPGAERRPDRIQLGTPAPVG
jgi:CheY-like chemotaxis protein